MPDTTRQADLWDRWAEHFPDLYPDRDPAPAVAFLHEAAATGTALELGAGTGRIAVPLARRGTHVTAVEVSGGLARRLRTKAAGLPVSVAETDMATYQEGEYALVYAVHSTFFHLTDQRRQVACMRNVARMLAPAGVFVLSCFVPGSDLLAGRNMLALAGIGEDSVDIRATTVDASTQMLTYRELHLTAKGIRILPVEQRFCWPSELDLMAELAGMALESRYADFAKAPYRHESRSHVSVYRPTGHQPP
ncbi:class I SAM-dependent methyltransferase [Embleya sp. NPDC001921]